MRTLALGYHIVESPADQEKPLDELIKEGLQLQGIFGIMDPVRSEVPQLSSSAERLVLE